jgi:serine/threonine-protein kinase
MNALSLSPTQLGSGEWLDRYQLIAPIGEGGFGLVWLARLRGQRGFEKLVAIKVPRYVGNVHFENTLLDEARIAAAIDHENVVRVLDVGQVGALVFIVMEWIDGEPLSALLRGLERQGQDLPLAVALRIVSDLCGAAHAAHELRDAHGVELGVVHRDVSPQNVLITRTGRAKLIDFGIAKARDRAAEQTKIGALKGKTKYMSPEQAAGLGIDRRTDVFALGAVLFRLLVGRAPYESNDDVGTFHNLTRGGSVTVPEHVPAFVAQILEKALARSPGARFGTALDMQHALAAAMAVMEPFSTRAQVARLVHEHREAQPDEQLREDVHITTDRAPEELRSSERSFEVEITFSPDAGRPAPMVTARDEQTFHRPRAASKGLRWMYWIAAVNIGLLGMGIAAAHIEAVKHWISRM